MIRIKDVADYVRTSKASSVLLNILRKTANIFNFTEERHNRINRYVAVVNAYKQGISISDIEIKFGCSRRTIYDYLEKAGIERNRVLKPEEVKKAVIKDYKNKIPIAKICELHNVSTRYVHDKAREAGLRRNKK